MFDIILLVVAVSVALLFFANFFNMEYIERSWKTVKNSTVFVFYLLLGNVDKTGKSLKDFPEKTGEIAVVTGGARGIGKLIVRGLVDRGYHVIFTARDKKAGENAIEDLKRESLPGTVEVMELDLLSMESVRDLARDIKSKYPKINLLVNNAGVSSQTAKRVMTKDGFEKHMSTNYLGHFLLTHLLIPNLTSGAENGSGCSRVVNVSSCMHLAATLNLEDLNMARFYHSVDAYSKTKLAQVIRFLFLNNFRTFNIYMKFLFEYFSMDQKYKRLSFNTVDRFR